MSLFVIPFIPKIKCLYYFRYANRDWVFRHFQTDIIFELILLLHNNLSPEVHHHLFFYFIACLNEMRVNGIESFK